MTFSLHLLTVAIFYKVLVANAISLKSLNLVICCTFHDWRYVFTSSFKFLGSEYCKLNGCKHLWFYSMFTDVNKITVLTTIRHRYSPGKIDEPLPLFCGQLQGPWILLGLIEYIDLMVASLEHERQLLSKHLNMALHIKFHKIWHSFAILLFSIAN